MTYEQFIATRTWSENLATDCETFGPYEDFDVTHVQPGYIYCGSLFIERVVAWWPEASRERGAWHLLIERSEYITDDIDALERRLYRWAMSAGFGDELTPNDLPAWEGEAYEIAAKWVKIIGGGFHPDTRGKDYVWFNSDGKPLLSDEVAAEYDGDMDRLFAIAADPYETAIEAMRDADAVLDRRADDEGLTERYQRAAPIMLAALRDVLEVEGDLQASPNCSTKTVGEIVRAAIAAAEQN